MIAFDVMIVVLMTRGTQCFYAGVYNCKCSAGRGEDGRVNCPSEESRKEAEKHHYFLPDDVGGHVFTVPARSTEKNRALRQQLLTGAGVKEGSAKWNDAFALNERGLSFKKDIRICKCHFTSDDITVGQADGKLSLLPTACVRTPGHIIQHSPPARDHPTMRAATRIDPATAAPQNPVALAVARRLEDSAQETSVRMANLETTVARSQRETEAAHALADQGLQRRLACEARREADLNNFRELASELIAENSSLKDLVRILQESIADMAEEAEELRR
jgi:hypothetical protein